MLWKERYNDYRKEVCNAMKSDEFTRASIDTIIQKYKQVILYLFNVLCPRVLLVNHLHDQFYLVNIQAVADPGDPGFH